MPLLPPSEIFHSRSSSKFLNFWVVRMSPAAATRVSAPSTTFQPTGMLLSLKPRHPSVVWPSNSSRHPAARSAGVSLLSIVSADAVCAARAMGVNETASRDVSRLWRITEVLTVRVHDRQGRAKLRRGGQGRHGD